MAYKKVSDMTVTGRIRSLRIALGKAGHSKYDKYDAMYLRYVAEFYGTIEAAVDGLFEIEGEERVRTSTPVDF